MCGDDTEVAFPPERRDGGFVRETHNGRSGADVSRHGVQDLHGALQFQLLVQRHDTGLGPVVSDQDLPQDPIVELHKPDIERKGISIDEDGRLSVTANYDGERTTLWFGNLYCNSVTFIYLGLCFCNNCTVVCAISPFVLNFVDSKDFYAGL